MHADNRLKHPDFNVPLTLVSRYHSRISGAHVYNYHECYYASVCHKQENNSQIFDIM
jgi:hypothetical protein